MQNIYLYINIFLPSIANTKRTSSDRQCTPRGTCTPSWEPLQYTTSVCTFSKQGSSFQRTTAMVSNEATNYDYFI